MLRMRLRYSDGVEIIVFVVAVSIYLMYIYCAIYLIFAYVCSVGWGKLAIPFINKKLWVVARGRLELFGLRLLLACISY